MTDTDASTPAIVPCITDIEMEALRNGLGWLEQCRDAGQYVHPDVIPDMTLALEAIEERRNTPPVEE